VNEHPNWRRRMRYPLEAIRSTPEVVGTLKRVNELRTRPEISEGISEGTGEEATPS
jgi:hypothetical protein